MLVHFGSLLTGAEEESVLVPVGEHRQAARAGHIAHRGEGKDSAATPAAAPLPPFPSASLTFKPWI